MATKKAASTVKKSSPAKKTTPAKKPSATTKQTSTKAKVTTVKAVESQSTKPAFVRNNKVFSMTSTPLVAAMIAEFIGTFLLAALFITGQGQPILLLFGLVGIVLAVGAVSGGYANPALTVAAWVTKRIDGVRAIGYFVAQILGAMLALVILNGFIKAAAPEAPVDEAMMPGSTPQLFAAAAINETHGAIILLAEVMGSIIFGFMAASALRAGADRVVSALIMGFGFFVALMIAGSAAATLGANAILNPAVAVALQAIDFSTIWPITIYFVGAIAGTIGGFALYDYLRSATKNAPVA